MKNTIGASYRVSHMPSVIAACLLGASVMVLSAALADGEAPAEQTATVAPTVPVSGTAEGQLALDAVSDTAQTVSVVGASAFDLASGGGGTNPLRAISLLSGIDSPAIDPYGIVNTIGSQKGLRIRGELSMHGNGNGTLDGVAVMGIDPGPGTLFLIDNENIASVAVYQGAIAPERTSYFTTSGVVDTALRWPEKKAGVQASLSAGDYAFYRSALRVDSGDMGEEVAHARMFASASWTQADKWRGAGRAPDGKHNVAIGLAAEPTAGLEAKLFFAYGDMRQDDYRGLTYDQISALGTGRDTGFLSHSSSTATQAVLYQDYNREDFSSAMVLSEIRYAPSAQIAFTVKPFYFHERGYALTGMSTGMVRDWLIDHDSYGLTANAAGRIAIVDWQAGYAWTSQNLPGPPSAWKLYKPKADGSMKFAKWMILTKETGRHQVRSIYARAGTQYGPLSFEAGARYLWQHIPGLDEYDATGVGDVSYHAALAASDGVLTSRSAGGFDTGAFLPFAAARYAIRPDLTLKISAARNFGAEVFEVWPVFQKSAASFLALGYTADKLWKSIKPETSTATDIGLRWDFAGPLGAGYIEETGFYSNHRNKSVSYDPGIGISYGQNAARAHSYGFQTSAHVQPTEYIDIFAALAYTRNVFGADLPMLESADDDDRASVAVKGLQLPDVPLWSGNIGLSWQLGEISLSPVLRLVGSRYGDSLHTQKVPGYGIVDINAAYRLAVPAGKITASLSVNNLFDQAYIGFINASYYQSSSSSGIYFPGAPRTVWGKISFAR